MANYKITSEQLEIIKEYVKSNSYNIIEESFTIPNMRVPKEVILTDEEKQQIRNVNYNSINLDEAGDDGLMLSYIDVIINGLEKIKEGIILDIQIIKDNWYQPHMFITENLRSLGLGYKVLLKFIHEFGNLYVGAGRILNKDEIPHMLNKLALESDIESFRGKDGSILLVLKNNPDKEILRRIIN